MRYPPKVLPVTATAYSEDTSGRYDVYLCDATSNAIALTLTSPATRREVTVVKMDSSANLVTVKCNGTNAVIDGVVGTTGRVLSSQFESCRFVANGLADSSTPRYLSTTSAGGAFGASAVQRTTLALTNAQIKAIRATPITVVAAQGAGRIIIPVACTAFLAYGGNNAFTAAANDNLGLKHKDGTTASLMTGGVQAWVQATNSALSQFVPAVAAGSSTNISKANSDNQPLVVHNITAGEIAGNAAGDNTITLMVHYAVQTMTW